MKIKITCECGNEEESKQTEDGILNFNNFNVAFLEIDYILVSKCVKCGKQERIVYNW